MEWELIDPGKILLHTDACSAGLSWCHSIEKGWGQGERNVFLSTITMEFVCLPTCGGLKIFM